MNVPFAWLAAPLVALAQSPVQSPAKWADCARELAGFGELLGLVRAGDDARAAELKVAAARLCEACERCDAVDVAAYYSALTPEARRAGLEAETRWSALRDRIAAAGASGMHGAEWSQLRVQVTAELRELAERSMGEPDFVPAARALTLIARIDTQRAEEDPSLGAQERQRTIESAMRDAERADELLQRAGQIVPRLEPDWLLARLAVLRGDVRGARERFERAYELATRVGSDDFREHALRGLAGLARAAGDVRGEERTLERIATFRDPRESWPLARDWAARMLHADHAREAFEFLEDHAPESGAHVLDVAEWDLLRGSALLRLDDLDGAREHFERVAIGPAPELAVLALASLALHERREFEVVDLLDDPERVARFSPLGQQQAHALLGEALLASGEAERAAEELGRALALAQAWEHRHATASEADLERATIAGAAGSVIGERLGLHTVALLADAYARLERPAESLRVIEAAQARSLRRATVERDDLAAWAGQCELGLIAWVVGADFALAAHAIVDRDGRLDVACARIQRGRRSLDEAARRLREAALAGDGAQIARLCAEIQAELFPEPLAARLREAAARAQLDRPRLLLLAHGPLEELPFELLDFDSLCAASGVCPLALPGLPAARPGEAPSPDTLARWSLVGAPVDTAGRELLPGTRDELAALLELWPDSQLCTGPALTHARLVEALSRPQPIHIATHLVPDCAREDASYAPSSLLASGGERVCVHEIAALAPRIPLAVLSTCSSGGGLRVDAEGLQGLARAFLASGTRNLLVTLWPVEDGAAADYMRAFHRALKQGETPSRAAQRARAELRAAGFGPADWAAFRPLGRD